MLTHIEIEGFKSFGSPATKVEVTPLTFFVGPNASGKSNFLAALEFLQTAVRHDVETAVAEFGGISEVWNKRLREEGSSAPLRIRIRGEVFEDLGSFAFENHRLDAYDYELALDMQPGGGHFKVESERLIADISNSEGEQISHRVSRRANTVEVTSNLTNPIVKSTDKISIPQPASGRLIPNFSFDIVPVILRGRILNWKFYHINAATARQAYREIPWSGLGRSGENLSVALNQWKQHDGKALAAAEAALRGMVPGFAKLHPVSTGEKLSFQVEEDKVTDRFDPDSVSDGTVRLLALLTITLGVAPGDLIAIEEPENGLHPHLIPEIMALFRYCANEGAQVFATTHNPDFLDEAAPNEVFLCDKVNGFTRLVRVASIAHIEAFRRSFSLGELWEQGAMGGTP